MLLYCEDCGTVVRKSYESVRDLKKSAFKGSTQIGYSLPCPSLMCNLYKDEEGIKHMAAQQERLFTALSRIDLDD